MRDNKVLEIFQKHTKKKLKEMNLFRHLKKEAKEQAKLDKKKIKIEKLKPIK